MAADLRLVPVVVGPTAVGKTATLLELGRLLPITVISADSRQIYKELDIGTAKPTRAERELVPHLGIDLVKPGVRFSAGEYRRYVKDVLPRISRLPVIAGGTGFYVRAVTDGIFAEPSLDAHRRAVVRSWCAGLDDPAAAARKLDPLFVSGDRQRSGRVLEIGLLTGRPLSWWQRQHPGSPVVEPWYVRLTAPRGELHTRIRQRVIRMLDAGLVDEVRTLLDSGVPPDAPGLDGVGYREVVALLRGELPESELPERIAQSTRQYARRQETWFRNQVGERVRTVEVDDPVNAARKIAQMWDKENVS